MALNHEQQIAYQQRINRMKEDGFFLPSQRSLSGDTRHLIISYGGTGADALFGVKKLFEEILPPKELDERVRFLAIDTDKSTQKHTKEVKRADGTKVIEELDALTPAQFFQLSGSAARNLLKGGLDESVEAWLNPQLHAEIMANERYLNGDGASGHRQIGRLTLYPASTVSALTSRISTLVRELTDDSVANLKIFILTGIAGGTGSGTVIDLSYLVRHVVEKLPGSIKGRTQYCGFVLLPPTGTSSHEDDVDHGNRNGYAALKEINHFMTLKQRGERYKFSYGNGTVVDSGERIFDVCYLMDGVADGKAFGNPREKVVKVLAEAILDMITASQTADDGSTVQAVDSFMNDVDKFTKDMVSGTSITHAMRDADYIYCALGHSEFAMPANEIKAYVGNLLFQKMHAQFVKCANVQEEDAEEFVKAVIKRGVSNPQAVVRAVDAEIEPIFANLTKTKGGPYYAINLLKLAIEYVSVLRNKMVLFRPNGVNNDSLDMLERYFLKVNNDTFDVYTKVMDALKDLMESQFGAVVKATTHGNTYSFIPYTLGEADDKAQIVVSYLDGLVNGKNLTMLANALLKELVDNREAWVALVSTDLGNSKVAPAAMRKFWNDRLQEIVNSTMEDLLIKYYSGNPEAYYSTANHAATLPFLQEAANNIYQQMLGAGGAAQPMVELSPNGLTADNFNGHTYLMVPATAPHLMEELEKIVKVRGTANNAVKVCKSHAVDRIACYKQYTSIPAFKLEWTLRAEQAYERAAKATHGVGMHMSETAGGMQWKNFPNLLPKSTWSIVSANYTCNRERDLAELAEKLFADADRLDLLYGMLAVGGTKNTTYTARVLPAELRPSELLYKELDRCPDNSEQQKQKLAAIDAAAEECAMELFKRVGEWEDNKGIRGKLEASGVKFHEHNLWFPGVIMTVGPADVEPANWDKDMAARMLRKLPGTMYALNGTILVMEKLVQRVTKATMANILIKRFAQYLALGLFNYNEQLEQWEYEDTMGATHTLAELDGPVDESIQYYLMFNAFREDPNAIAKALEEAFNDLLPLSAPSRELRKERTAYIKEKGGELREEIAVWMKAKPAKPFEKYIKAKGLVFAAVNNFYAALFNEAKEIELMGYLPVDLGGEEEEEEEEDVPFFGF